MGFTAEKPDVKCMLPKGDATKLVETLTKNRDAVAKAQVDFLDQTIAVVQSALKAASEAENGTSKPAETTTATT
jgi:hypothetical protein